MLAESAYLDLIYTSVPQLVLTTYFMDYISQFVSFCFSDVNSRLIFIGICIGICVCLCTS